MAILDGLKSGYSTYFMPQPSSGLNYEVLTYNPNEGRAAQRSTTTKDGSKSSNSLDGLMGGLIDYSEHASEIKDFEQGLRNNLEADLMQNGPDGLTERDPYKQYIQGMGFLEKEKTNLAINERQLINVKDGYHNTMDALAQNRIGSNIAVIPARITPGAEGLPAGGGVGNSGMDIIGFKVNQETGARIPVPAFYKNEKGETIFNSDMDGFMTNEDFMNWQADNIGYDSDGRVQRLQSPIIYKAGEARDRLHQEMSDSAGKSVETLTRVMGEDFNTKQPVLMIDSVISNYDNIRDNIQTVLTNLSDHQFKAELVSNYAEAIRSGQLMYQMTMRGGKPVLESVPVHQVSLEEFLTNMVTGLADQLNIRHSVQEAPGQTGKFLTEQEKMTLEQISQDPRYHILEGKVQFRNFLSFGGAIDKDSVLTDQYVTAPVYVTDMGINYAAMKNQVLGAFSPNARPKQVEELPHASGIGQFSNGVIMPWGTVEDVSLMNARVWSHTGNVALHPALADQTGGKYTNEYQLKMDPDGNPRQVRYRTYDGKMDWGYDPNKEASALDLRLVDNVQVDLSEALRTGEKISYDFEYGLFDEYAIILAGDDLKKILIPVMGEGNTDWGVEKMNKALEIYSASVVRINPDTFNSKEHASRFFKGTDRVRGGGNYDHYVIKVLVPKSTGDMFDPSRTPTADNARRRQQVISTSDLINQATVSTIQERAILEQEARNQNR